jgi:oligoribonuclease NrnB/cAMP/cGMP phosphodiesterase (DHH superfamily)
MKSKLLSFNVNVEDIRNISTQAIQSILNRYEKNNKLTAEQLSKSLLKGTNKDALEGLKKIIDNSQQLIDEINQLSALIVEIEPLPSDTEVLKNTLDLEKNSLAVDGGSE